MAVATKIGILLFPMITKVTIEQTFLLKGHTQMECLKPD